MRQPGRARQSQRKRLVSDSQKDKVRAGFPVHALGSLLPNLDPAGDVVVSHPDMNRLLAQTPKVSALTGTRVFQRDGNSTAFALNLTSRVVPAQAGTQTVPQRAPWVWARRDGRESLYPLHAVDAPGFPPARE